MKIKLIKLLQEVVEKSIIREALMDVDSDVELIYDLYYKDAYEEIAKTGIVKKSMFNLKYYNTSYLKSPLSMQADKLNRCNIIINGQSNYYAPNNSRISVGINPSALDFAIENKGDIEKAASDIYNGESFLANFKPSTIKASIHHELVHWIDDTLHNRHIGKLANSGYLKNPKKDINSHKLEIQSQIHNIVQLKKANEETWDTITFHEMIRKSPSLTFIYNMLRNKPGDIFKQWRRDLKTRMYKEGLLGKNMQQ